MMRQALSITLPLLILARTAWAESLVATRMVRSQAIIVPADVALVPQAIPGALGDEAAAIGMEARVVLYPGRAIRAGDVGPAALIERNQIVALVFTRSGLSITTDARALGRAAEGEPIKVMNLASRTIVNGVVAPDGSVRVGGGP